MGARMDISHTGLGHRPRLRQHSSTDSVVPGVRAWHTLFQTLRAETYHTDLDDDTGLCGHQLSQLSLLQVQCVLAGCTRLL